jgi:bifunctional UDP-N-acetylglucosamine pyrophosphorylase / glucosamine-1-phosphate N-acetyltransferase
MSTKIACIVLCAGKSTRMKSTVSKMLHPVCGQPMCAWPIANALQMKSEPLIVVVGHQAKEIETTLSSRFGEQIVFALQSDPKGTGHAVKTALPFLKDFSGTILVLCGDTPLLQKSSLLEICHLRKTTKAKVALLTTTLLNPTGYGRILRNHHNQVVGIVEENEATFEQKAINEVNPAIYAFDAAFLKSSIENLQSHNLNNEFYLTDLIASAAKESPIPDIAICFEEALGINDQIQLAKAEAVLQKRITDHWMSEGVSCKAPDTIYIDSDVLLSPDVTLEPGVHLRGKCKIARHVYIETGTILTDTEIKEGARVFAYSICENAFIGPRAKVGPFARLRPETHLEEFVKIGNFVEVKKSYFRKNSKANHLAYIGDANVGDNSNIGAGTITCNYDGFQKHRTILGDDVFIGSNSTLIAPLSIENDAYVAAGSTITKNVPRDALGIGRTRQENKAGYGKHIKQRLKKKIAT